MMSMVKAQPKLLWGMKTHTLIATKALSIPGLLDYKVGKSRIINSPLGGSWTTTINEGDTINDILTQHITDPDSFSLPLEHQLDHAAVMGGLAPYNAAKWLRAAQTTPDTDLSYLYLSWALHYLSDSGMPWHATINPITQSLHTIVENYVDTNIVPKLITADIPVSSVTSISDSAWQLARNSDINPLYSAWQSKSVSVVDAILATDLQNVIGVCAGVIMNYKKINTSDKSWIPTVVIGSILILILIGGSYYVYKKSKRA